MTQQQITEQTPVPGVQVAKPDFYDRPVREQDGCEVCGGDISYPDKLCWDCARGGSNQDTRDA